MKHLFYLIRFEVENLEGIVVVATGSSLPWTDDRVWLKPGIPRIISGGFIACLNPVSVFSLWRLNTGIYFCTFILGLETILSA